jgi:hypothetical protein
MLRVAIVTESDGRWSTDFPDGQPTTQIRGELLMVRSAALYADVVELYSPWTAVLRQAYDGVRRLCDGDVLDIVSAMRPDLMMSAFRRGSTVEDRVAIVFEVLRAQPQWRTMREDAYELLGAFSHGIIREGFTTTEADPGAGIVQSRFARRVAGLAADPSIHLVFDESSSQLMQAVKSVLSEDEWGWRRHREAEFGGGFIARLPAFPIATLDQLLEVKGELSEPLDMYRESIVHEVVPLPVELRWRPS